MIDTENALTKNDIDEKSEGETDNDYRVDISYKDFDECFEYFPPVDKLCKDLYKKSIKDFIGYLIRFGIVCCLGFGVLLWSYFTKYITIKSILFLAGMVILAVCTRDDIVLKYDYKNLLWYHKLNFDGIFLTIVTDKVKLNKTNKKVIVLEDSYYLDVKDASEYAEVSIDELILIVRRDSEYHIISGEEFLGIEHEKRSLKEFLK